MYVKVYIFWCVCVYVYIYSEDSESSHVAQWVKNLTECP